MKQVNIPFTLFLWVSLSLFFPGCAEVRPPAPEVRQAAPVIQFPKLENAQAYNNRGLAHFDKGRYDQAVADFSQAIAIDPKNAAAYSNRGDTYLLMGRYDLAIADFTKVIEINPKLSVFYYLRGNAYFKKKDYDNCWNDYNMAQKFGYIIPPKVLEELREASGRE
ncbi:MAG: tetratricopeptide repeat protein [Thermodesulfobacteriota bacterium]